MYSHFHNCSPLLPIASPTESKMESYHGPVLLMGILTFPEKYQEGLIYCNSVPKSLGKVSGLPSSFYHVFIFFCIIIEGSQESIFPRVCTELDYWSNEENKTRSPCQDSFQATFIHLHISLLRKYVLVSAT